MTNKEGEMDRLKITVKNPKPRSVLARAVRDPQGPFTHKVVKDKTKFNRKTKHKKGLSHDD
jgi:hypothetical protein